MLLVQPDHSIPLSLPGSTRQSARGPAPALRLDARIILGFQAGHWPERCPGNGHDERWCVPLAALHGWR